MAVDAMPTNAPTMHGRMLKISHSKTTITRYGTIKIRSCIADIRNNYLSDQENAYQEFELTDAVQPFVAAPGSYPGKKFPECGSGRRFVLCPVFTSPSPTPESMPK